MPVTKSQLRKTLNLHLENSGFILNFDSEAFESHFMSFELLPDHNTTITTDEEIDRILHHVSEALKQVAEVYQQHGKQVNKAKRLPHGSLLFRYLQKRFLCIKPEVVYSSSGKD